MKTIAPMDRSKESPRPRPNPSPSFWALVREFAGGFDDGIEDT